MVKKLLCAALLLGLSACGDGNSISGEYIGLDNAWVDKLVFGPNDQVRAIDGEETATPLKVTRSLLRLGETRIR